MVLALGWIAEERLASLLPASFLRPPTIGGLVIARPLTGKSTAKIMRQPSALLPLLMSVAALTLVLGHVAVAGGGREADEGTAARLWWLLIAGQVPIVSYFAVTSLPRAPRPALLVLTLQAAALVANLATVRFFNL
jgi:hypothetical protein